MLADLAAGPRLVDPTLPGQGDALALALSDQGSLQPGDGELHPHAPAGELGDVLWVLGTVFLWGMVTMVVMGYLVATRNDRTQRPR